MDAALRLGDRHALHAVPAGLELQARVHAAALDAHDHFLVAAVLALVRADDLALPAPGFRIAQVHAQQIAGKQRRLVAAGAGADFQKDVATVVRVGRQQQVLQFGFNVGQALLELGQLLAGQFAQLRIVAGCQGLRLFERGQGVQVTPVAVGGGRQLGMLARQGGVALAVVGQGRVREQHGQLLVPLAGRAQAGFDGRFH